MSNDNLTQSYSPSPSGEGRGEGAMAAWKCLTHLCDRTLE